MNSTKDIWCPDCNQNLITKQELGMRGKCVSCYRREVASKRFDKPYVKFVDLPIGEQQEIIYRRATLRSKRNIEKPNKVNLCSKEVRNDMSSEKEHKKYTVKEIIDYVETLNPKIKTSRELYNEVKQTFPEWDKSFQNFCVNLKNHNINFRRMTPEEKLNACKAGFNKYMEANNKTSKNKIEPKKSKGVSPKVYTEDVMEVIHTFRTEEMTLREIYESLYALFPDKGITSGNLCTKLRRSGIVYKPTSKQEKQERMQAARDAKKKQLINMKMIDEHKQNLLVTEQEYVNNDIETTINCCSEQLDRFEPIRKEIKQVLDRKYKQLGCEIERNYTIDDYINFLDMWSYLSVHCNNLIRIRNDQHDIMNAYQNDIIHEMENVVAEPGDTYLQDKLHIMRNERRYYEYDKNDLTTLQPLFETSDNVKILEIKQRLENIRDKRQNPIYIPVVDTGMIEKYNWSIARNIGKP